MNVPRPVVVTVRLGCGGNSRRHSWVTSEGITVNGKAQLHSRPLATDRMGKKRPHPVSGSYLVRRDYIWLLAPTDRSFDSRYFGELIAENVVARVHPFWVVAGGALPPGDRLK